VQQRAHAPQFVESVYLASTAIQPEHQQLPPTFPVRRIANGLSQCHDRDCRVADRNPRAEQLLDGHVAPRFASPHSEGSFEYLDGRPELGSAELQ
jgi:hypothetical protein